MTNSAQGPSFCDYFRSFYYSVENTYHPPVDLSEATLRANGHIADGDAIPPSMRNNEEVQALLAQPRTLDREKTREQCAVLTRHGFTAREHDGIPCLCNIRTQENALIFHASINPEFIPMASDRGDYPRLTPEDKLLQIELLERIKKMAGTQFAVAVPNDSLILLDNQSQETDVSKKYCILADQDFSYMSRDETVAKIKQMSPEEQTTLASNLCFLIQKIGLASIDLERFRLTSDGRISIDTRPLGVLVAKQSAISRGSSIEKCARIGLTCLIQDVRKAFGTTPEEGDVFRAHIEAVHTEAMRPKLSKWKITLSVLSLGLLPLIYVIISLVQVRAIQSRCKKLNQLSASYDQRKDSLNSAERAAEITKLLNLAKSIFSLTEEVPFSHGQNILDKAMKS